ncbi:MAG: RpiB/LacA/LacB family sugar-phosphate isomerase, partial [Coriobacteriaceae bacterium]|nr:RpiB/LacA/LacB family sugar-phosphate isomerase [Coriobacteriaceae bacterium]
AAPVQTVQFAQLARKHNNANVIGLSGRFVPLETNEQIVDAFLTTEFAGGRHAGRVEKVMREDDPSFAGVGEEFGL